VSFYGIFICVNGHSNDLISRAPYGASTKTDYSNVGEPYSVVPIIAHGTNRRSNIWNLGMPYSRISCGPSKKHVKKQVFISLMCVVAKPIA
jgi:hypothetical protein